MKFFLACAVTILLGAILGAGILVGVYKGNWWVLAITTLAYTVAFGKLGCMPPSASHH